MEHTSTEDPAYTAAVADLLGVLAYGELTAFIRMAVDSDLAPTLALKSSMAGLAHTEFVQYSQLIEHMRSRGIDAEAAMAPFVTPFAAYHERTKPRDWIEGLVKAFVGDGIAKDFYREMSAFVDEDTRAVMTRALDDEGQSGFVVGVVRDTLKTDRTAVGAARRSGAAGCSARRCRRRRRWPWSGTRCRRCSSGEGSTSPRSGRCSPGSPTTTASGWP